MAVALIGVDQPNETTYQRRTLRAPLMWRKMPTALDSSTTAAIRKRHAPSPAGVRSPPEVRAAPGRSVVSDFRTVQRRHPSCAATDGSCAATGGCS